MSTRPPTTTATTAAVDDRPARARPPAADRPARARAMARIVALSVGAAVAANVVVWLAGEVAGGDFTYTDGGETLSAAPGGVIVLTAVPLAVGLAVVALVARRWPVLVRVGQVVGSALAVLTIGGTLAADFDGPSTVALSVAHLVLVPALVLGLEAVRRVATPSPSGG